VISGFIAGCKGALRKIVGLRIFLVRYFSNALRNPKVMHVIGTFCAEVAVLVAVFPILETIIRRSETAQPAGSAAHQIPLPQLGPVALVSGIVVFVFLLLAIIIANRWG